jgi:cation transporter-like permease
MAFLDWLDKTDRKSIYFIGVAVGLAIAWVTGSIAYLKGAAPSTILPSLILLEFIVSVASILVAYLINTKSRKKKR